MAPRVDQALSRGSGQQQDPLHSGLSGVSAYGKRIMGEVYLIMKNLSEITKHLLRLNRPEAGGLGRAPMNNSPGATKRA